MDHQSIEAIVTGVTAAISTIVTAIIIIKSL
jgi:hypothetical protein